MANTGKITQIIGPVVDVAFSEAGATLPNIYNSLQVNRDNGSPLVLEVQQHLRCKPSVLSIAMVRTMFSPRCC